MPTRSYVTKYEFRGQGGNAEIDRTVKKLKELDALSIRVAGNLAKIGTDLAALKAYNAELGKVVAAIASLPPGANAAATALGKVKGNPAALSATNKSLVAMKANLASVQAAAQAAGPAVAGVGGGAGKPAEGGGGGTIASSTRKFVTTGKALGVGAAFAASRAIVAAGKGRRDALTDAEARVAGVRENLKGYASIRKAPGVTDAILDEVTGFAKEAGISVDQAGDYLSQYEGSVTFGRDAGNIGGVAGKDISQKDQDALANRLKVAGAKFGTRVGVDAETAADLVALSLQYKRANNETDLAGDIGGFHYGVDQGRGDIPTLMRSAMGQAGATIKSGQMRSLPELGAWAGVVSGFTKTASSVGTAIGGIDRLLNTSGSKGGADFLREIGADKVSSDYEKLGLLKRHLDQNGVKDIPNYLKGKGFGNVTDIRNVTGILGQYDTLGMRIKESENYSRNGADVLARNDVNQQSIEVSRARAMAQEDVSIINQGRRAERLEAGRAATRAIMNDPRTNDPAKWNRGQLKAGGWFESAGDALGGWMSGEGATGEQQRVDIEMSQRMIQGLSRAGVDARKEFPGLAANNYQGWVLKDTWHTQNTPELADEYARATARAQQVGADPMGGAPRQAAAALRNAADQLDKIPGPARGGGDAGAGFVPGRP